MKELFPKLFLHLCITMRSVCLCVCVWGQEKAQIKRSASRLNCCLRLVCVCVWVGVA